LLAFFDDEPSSSTYGERIEHCPGCGQRLVIHNLLPKKSPHREPRKSEDLRVRGSRSGAAS